MSGTSTGGKLAAATIKARHGEDFYKNIGRVGGAKGHTGGFYANRDQLEKQVLKVVELVK